MKQIKVFYKAYALIIVRTMEFAHLGVCLIFPVKLGFFNLDLK